MIRRACNAAAALMAGVWLAAEAAAQPTAGGVLSLTDAVNEALAKNERLVNQGDTVAQADLGLRLARNAFRPKVTPNVFGSLGRSDISSQTYRVDLSQKLTTGTEFRLSTGTASSLIPGDAGDVLFYSADTTLTVSQPLLRGFGPAVSRRGLTSAEWRKEDAHRQQVLAEHQVAVDVAAAYYRVVSQRTFVEVARQSLVRARRLRDASEAKLDAGLVSQLDVLRSQQLVSQAEMQFFDAQGAVEDARDQLRSEGQLSAVRSALLKRTAMEWLVERSVIVDPDGVPIDPELLVLPEHDHHDHDEDHDHDHDHHDDDLNEND